MHPDSLKPSFVKRQARRVLIRKLDLNVYDGEYEGGRLVTGGGHFMICFVEEGGECFFFPPSPYLPCSLLLGFVKREN